MQPTGPEFATLLNAVVQRRDLGGDQMGRFMEDLLAGRLGDLEAGAVLVALRMKGESAQELAAAAAVLRTHMVRLPDAPASSLDTCGTGGDGLGTFNISTAVALVVAGAGVPVIKHGNRAVSSRSGSADVLASLGVAVEGGVSWAQRCLLEAGFAFCFAPHFHPVLARLAPLRRRLGVRTILNGLGPLANPGLTPYQLLGVGSLEWLDRQAEALALLGIRRAFVVCGQDGLDEVSLAAPTLVREVTGGQVRALEWRPEDFGLEACQLADVRADSAAHSAAMIRAVLAGDAGPARRLVLANAAAALLAAEQVKSLKEGVARAAEAVDSGRALNVLHRLIATIPG